MKPYRGAHGKSKPVERTRTLHPMQSSKKQESPRLAVGSVKPQEIVRIAAPYTNRVSDAFRRACGVPMRCGWMPYTVIRGEDYDDYQKRLQEAYK